MDVDAELNGLEPTVWARIDARARSREAAAGLAGVCALVIVFSSAIGVSTAAAPTNVAPGPFALHQPYAPSTALGH